MSCYLFVTFEMCYSCAFDRPCRYLKTTGAELVELNHYEQVVGVEVRPQAIDRATGFSSIS